MTFQSFLVIFPLHFVVEWEELFNENQATKFKVHTKMSSRIGVLRIFPGITPEAVSTLNYLIFNSSLSDITI